MDWFSIAFIISIAAPIPGLWMVLIVKPGIKKKTGKNLLPFICNTTLASGIIIYISFIICIIKGKHTDVSVEYEKYPIQKLTFSDVYFNNMECNSFSEEYVILENPSDKYKNIVVAETEHYTIQWLFKIRTSDSKYHVYLSEDVYQRFQDGNTTYECEE